MDDGSRVATADKEEEDAEEDDNIYSETPAAGNVTDRHLLREQSSLVVHLIPASSGKKEVKKIYISISSFLLSM